jgi:hypothetical protein
MPCLPGEQALVLGRVLLPVGSQELKHQVLKHQGKEIGRSFFQAMQ